jgi:NAD(P)-dependent dehydrogenase (short-subunit alcohol dehydrogenase family)
VNPEGKVAIVAGGASGMGKASAEALAAKGATVAVLDLPTSNGKEVAEALGNGATFHPMNVMDFEGTEQAINDVMTQHGKLHIAVNTAGGGASKRTIGREGPLPLEEFQHFINLNLVGSFNLNRWQAWYMSKNEPEDEERGCIINTASIAAYEGQIGQISYSAAKGGIVSMCLTMARDLGSMGIRVNAIAPSLFMTGLLTGANEDIIKVLTKDNAFPKRAGRPDEYAKLAVSIVENAMLNGGCIRLDAGTRFPPK